MTTDDLIADMRERITHAMNNLGELRSQTDDRDRRIVLMGKIEGLALARDYLRLYPPTHGIGGTDPGDGMWTPENVEEPT